MRVRLTLLLSITVIALSWIASVAIPNAISGETVAAGKELKDLECDGGFVMALSPLWDASSRGEQTREAAAETFLERHGVNHDAGVLARDATNRIALQVTGRIKAVVNVYSPPRGGWTVDSGFVCPEAVSE